MFVSFLYIYNMFLNIPNHPRCFDLDSMSALTLADLVPASLGTNFARGGGHKCSPRTKIFKVQTKSQHQTVTLFGVFGV